MPIAPGFSDDSIERLLTAYASLGTRPRTWLRASYRAAVNLEDPSVTSVEIEARLADGLEALRKLKAHLDAPALPLALSPDEIYGLAALEQLQGRPAVPADRLLAAPRAWRAVLARRHGILARAAASVGVVAAGGRHIGTGFLCADDWALTANHVTRWWPDALVLDDGPRAIVDLVPNDAGLDLALLRLAPAPAGTAPRRTFAPGGAHDLVELVFVIGFPIQRPDQPAPAVLDRIFLGGFGVKSVSPGRATPSVVDGLVVHDCTTLPGSSGSCLVSDAGAPLACHVAAEPPHNKAIPLWPEAVRRWIDRHGGS